MLDEKQIFKSLDKAGDFAGQEMFVAEIMITNGQYRYLVVFEDGVCDWYSFSELNVNPASIRNYDADKDIDYYGMLC